MSWTAPAVLDQLKSSLTLRAGLAGVQIATAAMGDEKMPEAIIFFGADGTQEWALLENNYPKQDIYTIEGATWINKAGAGETIAKAARDRAATLLSELEAQLRADQTVNGLVEMCELQAVRLEQGVNSNGRWCQITFGLLVTGFE